MLINDTRLTNLSVLSLHIGGKIGVAKRPIINPSNLHIVAYEVFTPNDPSISKYLLVSDIREFGSLGLIIDAGDELVLAGDVIRLDELLAVNFQLIGITVRDEDGKKLGKVSGYTLDTLQYSIQQLTVRQGLLKGISDTAGLLVHRSQIVEVNNTTIIVKSTKQQNALPDMEATRAAFVNPFRSAGQSPQVDNSSLTSL